jgi:hypothetical protein
MTNLAATISPLYNTLLYAKPSTPTRHQATNKNELSRSYYHVTNVLSDNKDMWKEPFKAQW